MLMKRCTDRPLVIHHVDEHWLWVNSRALALAGITDKPLPDPVEEKYIERDASGHPTGVLDEAAQEVMERALPPMSMDDQVRILKVGERYLNSFGVTSAVVLTGGLDDLRALDVLRKRGDLTLRVRQAFASVAVNHHMTPAFFADLETARTTWHDDWLSANIVKFFMDGDPTPPLYKPEDYNAIIKELDRRGYYVVSHALKAEGVKMALDGYRRAGAERAARCPYAGHARRTDQPRRHATFRATACRGQHAALVLLRSRKARQSLAQHPQHRRDDRVRQRLAVFVAAEPDRGH